MNDDTNEPDIAIPQYVLRTLIEGASRISSLDKELKSAGQITLHYTDEPNKPDFRKAVITATALLEGP